MAAEDMYSKLFVDEDSDWLGIMSDNEIPENFCFRTVDNDAQDEYGIVSVPKKDIPKLLRDIAEFAGLDILILPVPDPFDASTKITVHANPAVSSKVMLSSSSGFGFTERFTVPETLALIWKLAQHAVEANGSLNEVAFRKMTTDLRNVNNIQPQYVNSVARELVKLGYRKDPTVAANVKNGMHAFNNLPEVVGA